MANDDVRALLDDLRIGNEAAFAELYRRYTPRMYTVARSLVRSADAAEDIVQTVMIRMWHGRAHVRIAGDLAGYLYRATYNEARNVIRSEHRGSVTAARAMDETHVSPVDDTLAGDVPDLALYDAIAGLTGRTGDIFRLLWSGQFSQAEVAEMMGITVPAVKDARARAIRTLRAILGDAPGTL